MNDWTRRKTHKRSGPQSQAPESRLNIDAPEKRRWYIGDMLVDKLRQGHPRTGGEILARDMTLRDHLVAEALKAVIQRYSHGSLDDHVRGAYKYADEVIARRKEQNNE